MNSTGLHKECRCSSCLWMVLKVAENARQRETGPSLLCSFSFSALSLHSWGTRSTLVVDGKNAEMVRWASELCHPFSSKILESRARRNGVWACVPACKCSLRINFGLGNPTLEMSWLAGKKAQSAQHSSDSAPLNVGKFLRPNFLRPHIMLLTSACLPIINHVCLLFLPRVVCTSPSNS